MRNTTMYYNLIFSKGKLHYFKLNIQLSLLFVEINFFGHKQGMICIGTSVKDP